MNIYDIAKKARVSPATVSRVINGGANVSAAKRSLVEKIIEQENYTPNVFARGLTLNSIKTVGIICPVITDVNHAKPVSILEHQLRERGFDTLLCCTDRRYDNKIKYMNLLVNKRVDAIVLIGLTVEEVKKQKPFEDVANRVLLLVINGEIDSDNIYCVMCDEGRAICDMVKQLYGEGYRRIMYINDSETTIGMAKLNGYLGSMADCGLNGAPLLIQVDDSENVMEPTQAAVEQYLRDNPPPDAIIAADDILILAARRVLDAHGLTMPLIGFHNSRFSNCCAPEITSIDNNMETVCTTAIQLLMDVLSGRSCASKVMVSARVVERDTYRRRQNAPVK